MKGGRSIFSKLASWHFMKSLLTGPTLRIFSSLLLKNTFWRPAGSVSGTGINVIPSSPHLGALLEQPYLLPRLPPAQPVAPCSHWAELPLPPAQSCPFPLHWGFYNSQHSDMSTGETRGFVHLLEKQCFVIDHPYVKSGLKLRRNLYAYFPIFTLITEVSMTTT